ncbi:hypothetical protein IV203_032293 [Nitzschia inconspicua]|uniref:Protein kinase domain-containing protein n=1 Tax=Nitzschia inconspicua TaxID=303405 RepID=A0A9K3KJ92_9STRA|nr:hypothetical protein IV203_032293 [Nitzschia inconspicua]
MDEVQAKIDKQKEEEEERRQLLNQQKRQLLVSNVSEAAYDSESLETFRSCQVAEGACLGGYVSHKMFIEFVKAAHLMTNGDELRNEQVKTLKRTMDKVKSDMDTQYRPILSQRVPNSLFPVKYSGDGALFGSLAAEMLQFAVTELQQSQIDVGLIPKTCPCLFVSHQLIVSSTADQDSMDILESETTRPSKSKQQPVEFRVDILCWFNHRLPEMVSCCLASGLYCHYYLYEFFQHQANADMHASNIQILHQKPCLCIDIAGCYDVSSWVISVHALVKREFHGCWERPLWERSLLYRGSGMSAFVPVAAGLLAALANYPETTQDFGTRLGLVVGMVDGKAFKAYDDDSRDVTPNIDLIREFVDETAQLWTSEENDKLAIVEMCYHKSKWSGGANVISFISILEQLQKLHGKGLVHGDIRLMNLLSTGHIIDFDLVGLEHYPEGLFQIELDGRRHPEVYEAIVCERAHLLKPTKEHDTYSMAQVMKLFQVKVEVEEGQWWEEAIVKVENGNLDAAIKMLRNHESDVAHLIEDLLL